MSNTVRVRSVHHFASLIVASVAIRFCTSQAGGGGGRWWWQCSRWVVNMITAARDVAPAVASDPAAWWWWRCCCWPPSRCVVGWGGGGGRKRRSAAGRRWLLVDRQLPTWPAAAAGPLVRRLPLLLLSMAGHNWADLNRPPTRSAHTTLQYVESNSKQPISESISHSKIKNNSLLLFQVQSLLFFVLLLF